MIDHVSAYSAFANGGHRVRPMDVLEVRDAAGTLLESNPPQVDAGDRVLPASATYQLTDILKGAVHPSMALPVAAKSGTTTDFKDAWYIGYTSDLAVASWMGRTVTQPTPHNESMSTSRSGGLWGETGPGASWHQFMQAYYPAKKPADWVRPAEVASVTLCKLTGQLAPPDVSPELAIQDLVVKPDPTAPSPAPCGSPAPGNGLPAATPGAGSGLPGVLPSISPPAIPIPSVPATVP
jgi:penicillin-binding protein 1A